MQVFSKHISNYKDEPMFLGSPVNVARYDQVNHQLLDKLTEKQLSFFWRPEEIDLSKDRSDFNNMDDASQHIFTSNLKYQILLDSVQGRAPNLLFGDLASLPEVEIWLFTWGFSETIHSRSYTHIIRNVYNDPSEVFDSIMLTPEIISRAEEVGKYYDKLDEVKDWYKKSPTAAVTKALKRALFMAIVSANILEAVRFYVSFACSFAFAERKTMEGNAKIIKLIARDEALHLGGTQYMLKTMINQEGYAEIFESSKEEIYEMFDMACDQELEWAKYLFSNGTMLGLSQHILEDYVKYIANTRMKSLKLDPLYQDKGNPLPWMNSWLSSDRVQVAPQETEITSYKTADLDGNIDTNKLGSFEL